MPELVDRIEALGKLQSMYIQIECACGNGNPVAKGVRKAYKAIERMPTIEPEVQHAYWEPSEVGEYYCTHCGAECDVDKFHKALLNPFCGKCGAKMDGGADNG